MLVPKRMGTRPTWLLHTDLYKFDLTISSDIPSWNIVLTWNLASIFAYLAPFIPQILGFILERLWFWVWSIFNGVTLKTGNKFRARSSKHIEVNGLRISGVFFNLKVSLKKKIINTHFDDYRKKE